MRTAPVWKRFAKALFAAAFWLAVWAAAAHRVGQELVLPSPASVGRAFLRMADEPAFWSTALASLGRVLRGLLWGACAGTLAAVLMAWVPLLDALCTPMLRLVRSTPVVSFIILALLWIGRERVPSFVAALMVMPVVADSLHTGLRGLDPQLLELGRAYRFGPWKKLRLIVLPSVLPGYGGACLTAAGLAWKSGIAAEVLCQPKLAIGTELHNSRLILETPELFAWTALVVILSAILELLIRLALRKKGER